LEPKIDQIVILFGQTNMTKAYVIMNKIQPVKLVRVQIRLDEEGAWYTSMELKSLGSNIKKQAEAAGAKCLPLGDVSSRSGAWKRAGAAGAAGRICEVLWAEKEFQQAIAVVWLPDGIGYLPQYARKEGWCDYR
jgi:hypothetical protein